MRPITPTQRALKHGRAMDLAGKRFGRLTVIARSFENHVSWKPRWECVCECGNTKGVLADCLRRGSVRSCGCLKQETDHVNGKKAMRHGMSRTNEYKIWHGMKRRCLDPRNADYERYGGRGIKVCERWLRFDAFIADMGLRPSLNHSIDRVDNDGNYEPSNCRWATAIEQRNNRRPQKKRSESVQ